MANALDSLVLTASSDVLPIFVIAGGILCGLALIISFAGMKSESFPSDNAMKGISALMVVVVVAVAGLAVATARDEQAIRAEENREAAEETEITTEEKVEEEGSETEGEAADPESGTGSASGSELIDLGAQVFSEQGCGGCHTLAAADSAGATGPSLDVVLPEQDAEMIRTSIVDPGAEISEGFGDGIMPSTYGDLPEEDIDALVAYLQDAVSGGGQVKSGAAESD